jgi:hypothetical protein
VTSTPDTRSPLERTPMARPTVPEAGPQPVEGRRHECSEDCLHDCPICEHEVDHERFHAPSCLIAVVGDYLATANSLPAPATLYEAEQRMRQAWDAAR